MLNEVFSEKINAALKQLAIPGDPAGLYRPVSYFLSIGGKRLRPLMVLLGNDLFDGDTDEAIPAALAIEIFHNFTLVHDDIMDNAPLRRKKATVHKKWNVNTAILSGDVMLVKAYQQLEKINKDKLPEVFRIFNEAATLVCEGQQLDMDFEKERKVKLGQYLRMIELKTAALLGASFSMGAVIAGANKEDAHSIGNFGNHLGIMFQLQDDLLDAYGDAKKFGKQHGGDIIANKKTYLYNKALELASPKEKKELIALFSRKTSAPQKKIKSVLALYDSLDIQAQTKKEMDKQYHSAISHLQSLGVKEEKKQFLIRFADALLKREK